VCSDENDDETWMAKTLETGLLKYAQQNKASLIVFKDFMHSIGPSSRRSFKRLRAHGEGMPMTRLLLRYDNWTNISNAKQGYPEIFAPKFRKTERVPKIEMQVVTDIAP